MPDSHTPADPAPDMPAVIERTTRYAYLHHAVPADDEAAFLLTINVEWRGGDSWAVTRQGMCLSRDGSWDWEARDNEDYWYSAHRFTLPEARDRAMEAAARAYQLWLERVARMDALRAAKVARG